jgi:cytoskeleton protein RodZ
MSEPDRAELGAPPAHTDQKAASGFGPALAQARVRAGLSVEQAAARLRLNSKQLDALEQEDLEALPAAAYVNGFVRNYARELKIDPYPLVEDLNAKLRLRGLGAHPLDLGPSGARRAPAMDDRDWRHLVLAGIVMALVCAGLIGVWMARSGGRTGDGVASRTPARPATPTAQVETATFEPPAPSPAVPPETGSRGPATAPTPEAGAPAAATSAAAWEPGPSAPTTSAGGAAAGVPRLAAPPAPAGASAVALVARPAAAPGTVGGPIASPRAAAAPGSTIGLVLRFNDRSWVEVTQPDGRVLLSRNGEPGSMELVNTSAPLLLVLGRAEAVQVEYRGQAVDLKPYVNNNGVAHLMFADGRITSGGQNNR